MAKNHNPDKPKLPRPVRKPKVGNGRAQRVKLAAWIKRDDPNRDRSAK